MLPKMTPQQKTLHDMNGTLFVVSGRAEMASRDRPECKHLLEISAAAVCLGEQIKKLQLLCGNA